MNTSPILLLNLILLLFTSCKQKETTLSYEERKKLPPEVNARAPQPPPNTGATQTGGAASPATQPGQPGQPPAPNPSGTPDTQPGADTSSPAPAEKQPPGK